MYPRSPGFNGGWKLRNITKINIQNYKALFDVFSGYCMNHVVGNNQ